MDGGGLVGCRGVKLRVKVIRIVVERDRMKIVEGKKKRRKELYYNKVLGWYILGWYVLGVVFEF